jgi:predicted transcriptional regulator
MTIFNRIPVPTPKPPPQPKTNRRARTVRITEKGRAYLDQMEAAKEKAA